MSNQNFQIGTIYLTDAGTNTLEFRNLTDGLGKLSLTSTQYPTIRKNTATKGYVDASIAGLVINTVVDYASAGSDINLLEDVESGDPIDSSYILNVGDLILIKDQIDQTQNGVYTVNESGAPTRIPASQLAFGQLYYVEEGAANLGKVYTSNGTYTGLGNTPVYGVDNITFAPVAIWPQAPFGGTNGTGGTGSILVGPGMILGNYGTVSGPATGITLGSAFVLGTNGTLNLANSGTGSITSIVAGIGLTGGTITTSGTIALGTTGITAGTYGSGTQYPQITVNAQGQITGVNLITVPATGITQIIANNGLTGGTITGTGVIGLSPIVGSSILGNGSATSAVPTSIVIGSNLSINSGTLNASAQSTAGSGLVNNSGTLSVRVDGTTILNNGTLSVGTISTTNIADQSITYSKLQVESAKTILGNSGTAAAVPSEINIGTGLNLNGGTLSATGTGTLTSILTGTGLIGGPITGTGTIAMATTGVTAGTYGSGTSTVQISVDALGRILSASSIPLSGAFFWNNVAGTTQFMAPNNGYITSNPVQTQVILPPTVPQGAVLAVAGANNGGWQIQQNAGQTIHFGYKNTTTGTAGFLQSTYKYDYVELLCIVANTDFIVKASVGNIGIA